MCTLIRPLPLPLVSLAEQEYTTPGSQSTCADALHAGSSPHQGLWEGEERREGSQN